MNKSDKTRVIFRKLRGEIIALFPELPGTNNPYTDMLSYQHMGQHGSANADIIQFSTPATPEEYVPLLKELESIGYSLTIAQRVTHADFVKRRDACRFEFTERK